MTIDLFRTKIHSIEIAGVGTIHYKRPSAGMSRRVAGLQQSDEPDAMKGFSLMAELIATCMVDEKGNRKFNSAEDALEIDSEAFSAIGLKLLDLIREPALTVGDAEKNSSSIPN